MKSLEKLLIPLNKVLGLEKQKASSKIGKLLLLPLCLSQKREKETKSDLQIFCEKNKTIKENLDKLSSIEKTLNWTRCSEMLVTITEVSLVTNKVWATNKEAT